ncbi:MAG: DUF308 domain-containing protein [Bradyrhizobium sp.]
MANRLARVECAAFGVGLMIIALLLAGICAVLIGAAAIVFGIPVREFSFGNTMILVGTAALCSGLIVFAQLLVVRELKNLARLLPRTPVPPPYSKAALALAALPDGEEQPPRHQSAPAEPPAMAPPWREDAAPRERTPRQEMEPEAAEAASRQAPKRHNVLFSSTLRRDREREKARLGEPAMPDRSSPRSGEPAEARPPGFDEAWPKSERASGSEAAPQRRGSRAFSRLADADAGIATADDPPSQGGRSEDKGAVTVVKSGVVDGMAYSLYSDGSIEAQMPEGMMRFASIDELRSHLDQRP